MSSPETFTVNTGSGSLLLPQSIIKTPPRPSTAGANMQRLTQFESPSGNRNPRKIHSRNKSSSPKHTRRHRPSTAVASARKSSSQWPNKQQFRSWRKHSKQLSSLRPRPLPPTSFQDEILARKTWRDIDVSQLELSPLSSISSETIMMQDKIQRFLAKLGSAPFGKSTEIFTELANCTKVCFKRMEQNLATIAEETTSVSVAQQAMHALSHSTLLQRVWKDAEYYVSSLSHRAAAAQEQNNKKLSDLESKYQSRIFELEQQVKELKPEPLEIDSDEFDNSSEEDGDIEYTEDSKEGKIKRDTKKKEVDKEKRQGIVGRYTLNARDRNKRRCYSRTDEKLRKINSDLMKWHEDQDAENEIMYTRLDIRKMECKRKREGKNNNEGENETAVQMTPAARHAEIENFMYMLTKVDEHGRALMFEELFMSFESMHRVEAIAGMLMQIPSSNRYSLMTDLHNEMKSDQKRRFLNLTLEECDEELAHMLFESLCEKIPLNRRRDLLHEQVDTLGTEQMMKIIQELISESINESSRIKLVEGLTSFLSPAEKRECIVNIIFGLAIENPGHGYEINDTLILQQEDGGDNKLKVQVTAVGENGKITGTSLISTGKGYKAGIATCLEKDEELSSGGGILGSNSSNGSGATFLLEPSSRSTRQSLLTRLAIVMPKIRTMLEQGNSPERSPYASPRSSSK